MKYDSQKEDCNTLIEVYPRNYVILEDTAKDKDDDSRRRALYVTKKTETKDDGRQVVVWDAERHGQAWVPSRVADRLCKVHDGERSDPMLDAQVRKNLAPIARVVETRSSKKRREPDSEESES